jgi:hypothetical protein
MLWVNGATFPKTSPNSFRVFVPAATRLRLQWMYRGAVLSIASDIALFVGGPGQAAFATGLDRRKSHAKPQKNARNAKKDRAWNSREKHKENTTTADQRGWETRL